MFGVGHGPVDAVVISDAGLPGEGFASVVSSTERVLVGSTGRAVRVRLMMIKVAAVGRCGAGGEAAGAGADLDCFGEPGGCVPAQFGGVQQPAAVVGEEPGEQHLDAAVGVDGVGDQLPKNLTRDEPGPVSQFGRVSVAPSRLDNGTTTPMRIVRGRRISFGL